MSDKFTVLFDFRIEEDMPFAPRPPRVPAGGFVRVVFQAIVRSSARR